MEVPRHWRLKKQRYALVGVTCPQCKSHLFPPREVCPYCAAETKEAVAFQKQAVAVEQPVHTR